ncbi:MAG: hypothetical protein HKM93_23495 [Desulfobacteraceae bacterium]|nr:hypothetical protein [Desulfobacteraceae bacterium]
MIRGYNNRIQQRIQWILLFIAAFLAATIIMGAVNQVFPTAKDSGGSRPAAVTGLRIVMD